MLDAIEKSDGTRASVTDELLKTNITDGILGTFSINENGDTTANPVTVYQQVDPERAEPARRTRSIDPVREPREGRLAAKSYSLGGRPCGPSPEAFRE